MADGECGALGVDLDGRGVQAAFGRGLSEEESHDAGGFHAQAGTESEFDPRAVDAGFELILLALDFERGGSGFGGGGKSKRDLEWTGVILKDVVRSFNGAFQVATYSLQRELSAAGVSLVLDAGCE